MHINNVTLCYTFSELDDNPIEKIDELQKNLDSVFHSQIMFNNNLKNYYDINIPRLQIISNDKKIHFMMSMMNVIININTEGLDNDDVILEINEKVQFFFDLLKDLYHVDILYTSIKIELSGEQNDVIEELTNKYHINEDCEDIYVKYVSKIDDSYYLCKIDNSSKEINFNIQLKNGVKASDNDMFLRTCG